MRFFKNNKIAIFSDIHIGVHKDSKFWHDISFEWAKWFISDLKKRQITDIVFCGDWFHTREEISVDSLSFGTKLLKLFDEFTVHMIVGNHDCFLKDSSEVNSISPYNEWKNVHVYDKVFNFEHSGKSINFIPWGIKLDEIPKSDITFGHFEINLFKMNSFALCEDGFTAEELLSKSPIIISGHFHLRDHRLYNDGDMILYVGNPFQMDFNDAGSIKGYYTLDFTDNSLEFVENLVSPKHTNLSLSFLLSEKTITEKVKSLITNRLVKFKIDRRISSDDMEYLLNKLKELNPIEFITDYHAEISDYSLDQENKKDLSGIDLEQAISEFIEELDVNQKQEIKRYTIELLKKNL